MKKLMAVLLVIVALAGIMSFAGCEHVMPAEVDRFFATPIILTSTTQVVKRKIEVATTDSTYLVEFNNTNPLIDIEFVRDRNYYLVHLKEIQEKGQIISVPVKVVDSELEHMYFEGEVKFVIQGQEGYIADILSTMVKGKWSKEGNVYSYYYTFSHDVDYNTLRKGYESVTYDYANNILSHNYQCEIYDNGSKVESIVIIGSYDINTKTISTGNDKIVIGKKSDTHIDNVDKVGGILPWISVIDKLNTKLNKPELLSGLKKYTVDALIEYNNSVGV